MANFFSEAASEAKKIPWWGWVVGGAAVLLFGSHLLSQNSGTGTASADAAGLSADGDVGDIGTPGPDDGASGPLPHTPPSSTPPPPTGNPPAPKPAPSSTKTYTVRSGDTLNAIASRYHVDEPALYQLNAGTIEATAKSHGFGSSDHGHWIFPGEVLKIPA